MQDDLDRILFREQTILARLDEIAAEIVQDYRDHELTVLRKLEEAQPLSVRICALLENLYARHPRLRDCDTSLLVGAGVEFVGPQLRTATARRNCHHAARARRVAPP